MFKIFKKDKLTDIVPNEYIEINENNYEPILNVDFTDNMAKLTLPYDVLFPIDTEDLKKYNFVTLEDYREDVCTTLTHSCRHCSRPVAWDTPQGIEGHLDRCLFNEKNSPCTLCKYLTIYMEAPYPKNMKMYNSPDVEWAFLNYNSPYCERYEKYLKEEDLLAKHPDCFEVSSLEAKTKHTKEYDKYLELIDQTHEDYKVREDE